MSRSPLRIPPFLRTLEAVWECVPDQRFGQLVMNLCRDHEGRFEDPWNWEESEWRERMEAYYARISAQPSALPGSPLVGGDRG